MSENNKDSLIHEDIVVSQTPEENKNQESVEEDKNSAVTDTTSNIHEPTENKEVVKEDIDIIEHDDQTEDEKNAQIEREKEKEKQQQLETLRNVLQRAQGLKQDGNKYFKTNDNQNSEKYYREGVDLVESFIQNYKGDTQNPDFDSLLKERVFLYSNLANTLQRMENYMEIFNIDMYIITQLDPNWDKSYNRIINTCIKKQDIGVAEKYAALFRARFSKDTLSKYTQTFDLLEEEIKKRPQATAANTTSFTNITDNTSENLSEIRSQTSSTIKRKKRSSFNIFARYFLGSCMMVGGIFAFYLLFKGRYSGRKSLSN